MFLEKYLDKTTTRAISMQFTLFYPSSMYFVSVSMLWEVNNAG